MEAIKLETIYLKEDVFVPDPDGISGNWYRKGWYYREPNDPELPGVVGPFATEQEAREFYFQF